jgi:hypothetical protein
VYDADRLTSLTDITPSLYMLLGHRPINSNFVAGQPMFAKSAEELHRYQRDHLFFASDARAAYGILTGGSRFMYVTYDSPRISVLFDLGNDPKGLRDALTPRAREKYDHQIVNDLHSIAESYQFKPNGGSSAAFNWVNEE